MRELLRKEQSASKFTPGTQNFQSNQYGISDLASGHTGQELKIDGCILEQGSQYKYLYSYLPIPPSLRRSKALRYINPGNNM